MKEGSKQAHTGLTALPFGPYDPVVPMVLEEFVADGVGAWSLWQVHIRDAGP